LDSAGKEQAAYEALLDSIPGFEESLSTADAPEIRKWADIVR
jgi:hypothetical protein